MVPPHHRNSNILAFSLLLTMVTLIFGRVLDHTASTITPLPAAPPEAVVAMSQLDHDFLIPKLASSM